MKLDNRRYRTDDEHMFNSWAVKGSSVFNVVYTIRTKELRMITSLTRFGVGAIKNGEVVVDGSIEYKFMKGNQTWFHAIVRSGE